jgi:hypothetical protein
MTVVVVVAAGAGAVDTACDVQVSVWAGTGIEYSDPGIDSVVDSVYPRS